MTKNNNKTKTEIESKLETGAESAAEADSSEFAFIHTLPESLAEVLKPLSTYLLFPALYGMTKDEIEQALAVTFAFNPIMMGKENIVEEAKRYLSAADKVAKISTKFKRQDDTIIEARSPEDWGAPLGDIFIALQAAAEEASKGDYDHVMAIRCILGKEYALATYLISIMCFIQKELGDQLNSREDTAEHAPMLIAFVGLTVSALILRGIIKAYDVSVDRIIELVQKTEAGIRRSTKSEMVVWIRTMIKVLGEKFFPERTAGANANVNGTSERIM